MVCATTSGSGPPLHVSVLPFISPSSYTHYLKSISAASSHIILGFPSSFICFKISYAQIFCYPSSTILIVDPTQHYYYYLLWSTWNKHWKDFQSHCNSSKYIDERFRSHIVNELNHQAFLSSSNNLSHTFFSTFKIHHLHTSVLWFSYILYNSQNI